MFRVVADANGGTQVPLTQEEITAREAESAAAAAAIAAVAYKEARKEAYGDIGDQLDEIYWDQVNGTTVWKDRIASIKAAYPKPA